MTTPQEAANALTWTYTDDPPHPTGLHRIATAPELAAYTGLAVSTICRRAARGDLPYLRKLDGMHGPWLFDRDTVLHLLNT